MARPDRPAPSACRVRRRSCPVPPARSDPRDRRACRAMPRRCPAPLVPQAALARSARPGLRALVVRPARVDQLDPRVRRVSSARADPRVPPALPARKVPRGTRAPPAPRVPRATSPVRPDLPDCKAVAVLPARRVRCRTSRVLRDRRVPPAPPGRRGMPARAGRRAPRALARPALLVWMVRPALAVLRGQRGLLVGLARRDRPGPRVRPDRRRACSP